MSLFDDMANSKVQNRGVKIEEDGTFLVKITDTKLQSSNAGLGTLFVVEFEVLQGTPDNPAGCQRSWVQFPESRKLTDPANIKQFVAACLGDQSADPQVTAAHFEAAANGAHNGTILKLQVKRIKTKSNRDFSAHSWAPAPAEVVPELELTKDQWLAGDGPGKVHPKNPSFEYHPDHVDWGVRAKA